MILPEEQWTVDRKSQRPLQAKGSAHKKLCRQVKEIFNCFLQGPHQGVTNLRGCSQQKVVLSTAYLQKLLLMQWLFESLGLRQLMLLCMHSPKPLLHCSSYNHCYC